MKEILHEYGFLIIAVIVVVALIVIVTAAKKNIATSANDTTTSLQSMGSSAITNANTQMQDAIKQEH